MKHFFERLSPRRSLQNRLSLSYLLFVLAPLFVATTLFIQYQQREFQQTYLRSVQNNMRQLGFSLDEQVSALSLGASVLAADDDLTVLLTGAGITDSDIIMRTVYGFERSQKSVMIQNPIIATLRVLHGNDAYFDIYDYLYYDSQVADGTWQARLSANGEHARTELMSEHVASERLHGSFSFASARSAGMWYFYRGVYKRSLSLVGIIEIGVTDSAIGRFLRGYRCADGEWLLLRTIDGETVYESREGTAVAADAPSGEGFQDGDYWVEPYRLSKMDSVLYHGIPLSSFTQSDRERWAYGLFVLGMVMLVLLISMQVSRSMLKRLSLLSGTMTEIRHNRRHQRVQIKGSDEIASLAVRFNAMLDHIEQIEEVERQWIYRSLVNQIAPHFMCNALDAIRMQAQLRGHRDIAHMAEMINRYFRYNLCGEDSSASITEELQNVKDYIEIHNVIRSIAIELQIALDPKMTQRKDTIMIPRFILQPIVENSVRHGFGTRDADCYVSISVSVEDGDVVFVVEDNGEGMDKEALSVLMEQVGSGETGANSIGLNNVYQRVRYHYGDRCTLHIESYPGIGTQVELRIAGIGEEKKT